MIQLRWYETTNIQRKLQYRVKYDTSIYAGMPTEEQKLKNANYQWSEWMDVPEIFEQ